MPFVPITDLKKSKELWRRLQTDRELVITKDGQPKAILIGIESDDFETTLREIRRALFSVAVGNVRSRVGKDLPTEDVAANAISRARAERRKDEDCS
jgi:PHD/YefM family antitoxin component YafN of YafNO toxin-antitoxin module